MCGIVGYIGKRDAAKEVLIPGLGRVDERGYDSAGVSVIQKDGLVHTIKAVKTANESPAAMLMRHEGLAELEGANVGMAHTRWATHGAVTEPNAHPHACCQNKIFVVHNGIIENEAELRAELSVRHRLRSETDSELIAHLIEEELGRDPSLPLYKAVRQAVRRLEGTWGIVVLSSDHPDRLVAARHGSPLIIGTGKGEMFVASLEDAFDKFTKVRNVMNEGDIVTITSEGFVGADLQEEIIEIEEDEIEETNEPGAIMRREIFEQPRTVLRALNHGGRLHFENHTAKLGGLDHRDTDLLELRHLRLVACGTAKYAGDFGALILDHYGGFDTVRSLIASEASPETFPPLTGVCGISQSGETMDTIVALQEAQANRHLIFSIVNRVGKAIPRLTDLGIYTNSGVEKAVASTKVFTAQTIIFILLALWFGRQRGKISAKEGRNVRRALMELPIAIQHILGCEDEIIEIAKVINERNNAFYIGRLLGTPIAYEGALKITEVAEYHAEAVPAGELKHGRIALIEDGFPVIGIMPSEMKFKDMVSSMKEVKARGATTIAITDESASMDNGCFDHVFRVPNSHRWLVPILCNIPLQLIAYHVAMMRGLNPDRPRNLAKSVTVK